MKPHLEMDAIEGCAVGRDPRKLSAFALEAMGHVKSPLLKLIRGNCLDCCGGSTAEVRRCGQVACKLWPYRMRTNPFYGQDVGETEDAVA